MSACVSNEASSDDPRSRNRSRNRREGEGLPLGEGALGGDADLVLVARDGDSAAENAGLAVDLDAVVEELLKGRDVHDLVLHGLAAVDGEGLSLLLAALGRSGLLESHGRD
jgi:hypothetical protein